ncbi:A-kinase-interacting protein 1 [Poecilia latipinna]|uniref:A kinase (PRKA) interacting protein 1 n=1 Tax=Poecilia latipinna TaxID=48699 RepID=A0A3B3U7S4_9TELE|nr:PREDICTED: A-kinase-interacting protein 1 [Poecilia latipinna]XP_014876834.1 PREDICTED: A-kinase-interacting protein 1 [Poecilia latipinna]
MASQAWLEFSLRRSSRLGLEVLERASRRNVDWTSIRASQTSATSDQGATENTQSELRDAFANIKSFMAQTSHHCQKFYDSGSCREHSAVEKEHISKFHTRPRPGQSTSTQPRRKPRFPQNPVLARDEDFYIEVSPGMYSVSASVPDSQPQTHLVSIQPGESVVLTFNF